MKYCGIDCGSTGAVAFIEGAEYSVFDMPVKNDLYGGGEVVCFLELFELIYQNSPDLIVFEKQHPRFITGKIVSFAMGRNYQSVIHAVEKYSTQGHKKVSVICVKPEQWKTPLGVMTGKLKDKDNKNKLAIKEKTIELVKSIFPNAMIYGSKGGLKDGRCDALAIAEYARRKY